MALSPFYGWSEPDNSSLVKNGAADIRTLGDSIDTSLWNSGFGKAGGNKIINGDFSINQRNFTSSTASGYGFDRWVADISGDGTATFSTQVFATGAAPVAGYEGTNFCRIVTTGQTSAAVNSRLGQRIENVRTFAGQTITVSFWAKAATGTPSIAVELQQNFGTGGSPSATVNTLIATPAKLAITTSWARYSYTIAVPSISGKTVGTNNDSHLIVGIYVSAGSNFNARTGTLGIQSNTFDIWGVQAEYGAKMTPFQTASGGSPQAELAMCQRYYVRLGAANGVTTAAYATYGNGYTTSTTNASIAIPLPVPMRAIPYTIEFSTLAILSNVSTLLAASAVVFNSSNNSNTRAHVEVTVTGAVAASYQTLENNNSTSGYIGFSAEL